MESTSTHGRPHALTKLEHILVPVDFSPCSRRAVDVATFFALKSDATVDVMHVWEPPRGLPLIAGMVESAGERWRTLQDFVRTRAARQMQELLTAVEMRRIHARGRLAIGDPCDAILAVAPLGYDLIVMGSRGKSKVMNRVMGGLAAKVASLAICPVVIVPDEP
jgi:nucleotide-binding universal stress UspA family protein